MWFVHSQMQYYVGYTWFPFRNTDGLDATEASFVFVERQPPLSCLVFLTQVLTSKLNRPTFHWIGLNCWSYLCTLPKDIMIADAPSFVELSSL